MPIFALIYPGITTLLRALVLRKAGFGAVGFVLACGPLLGAALPYALLGLERSAGSEGAGGVLLLAPLAYPFLSLAPLVVLAAVRWPAVKVRA